MRLVALVVIGVAMWGLVPEAVAAGSFRETFDDGGAAGWYPIYGDWRVTDGALHQTADGANAHVILTRIILRQGGIKARMRVDGPGGRGGQFIQVVENRSGGSSGTQASCAETKGFHKVPSIQCSVKFTHL